MTATAEVPLFENPDWILSAGGLEHKGTGYFIGRDLIGDRRGDGLWSWPMHMSEKIWVRPESFAQAFSEALVTYGLVPDAALAASFIASAPDRAERDRRRLYPSAGADAIRIRPEAGLAAPADEPDLPAWALPHGRPDRAAPRPSLLAAARR
jgi:hypothetical protein